MKELFSEAYIELTLDEVEKFKTDATFRRDVLIAANHISDETDRTVIISGPNEELGSYNAEVGQFKPAAIEEKETK